MVRIGRNWIPPEGLGSRLDLGKTTMNAVLYASRCVQSGKCIDRSEIVAAHSSRPFGSFVPTTSGRTHRVDGREAVHAGQSGWGTGNSRLTSPRGRSSGPAPEPSTPSSTCRTRSTCSTRSDPRSDRRERLPVVEDLGDLVVVRQRGARDPEHERDGRREHEGRVRALGAAVPPEGGDAHRRAAEAWMPRRVPVVEVALEDRRREAEIRSADREGRQADRRRHLVGGAHRLLRAAFPRARGSVQRSGSS